MSWFEVDQDMLDNSVERQKEFDSKETIFGLQEGEIHKVKTTMVYTDVSEGGAKYVKIEVENETNIKDSENLYITSGDEKGNKAYYEKNDKKYALPGLVKFEQFLRIFDLTINKLQPQTETIEEFGETKKVGMFKELIGKTLLVGVQKELSSFDDKDYSKAILHFKSIETPQEELDKLKKKIEKKPIIDKRKSSNSSNTASNDAKTDDNPWS